MTVMRPVKETIEEDYISGEYRISHDDSEEDIYKKYVKRYTTIFPYQWGIWITAYAMRNLMQLGQCCGHWLYSDTDSCYGRGWDFEAVSEYNNRCKSKLLKNGYGAVKHNGRDYWLGVAEHDGHYKEFICVGAKRYAVRKDDGSIKITVAGVPKATGAKVLENNLNNFRSGLVFPGSVTGKKTHAHIIADSIYIDEDGNECGDSIDMYDCDYQLSDAVVMDMKEMFISDVEMQIYE